MEKLKSIGFFAGLMLLILATVMTYLSAKELFSISPASAYEDRGIRIFEPFEVFSVQVRNTSAYSRDRRMNPTKTVYKVNYRAADGSGYKWADQAITLDRGERIVEEGIPVERRVLSIPSRGTYITVEPNQTAESFAAGLRQKYVLYLVLSAAYILVYLVIWGVILSKRRR